VVMLSTRTSFWVGSTQIGLSYADKKLFISALLINKSLSVY
jgi:hypothetical protein